MKLIKKLLIIFSDLLLTRNTWGSDLMYQKLRAVSQGQSLPTFRRYPNLSFQEGFGLPWNYWSGDMNNPRPARFLLTKSTQPDKDELDFLRGPMTRDDMILFSNAVGIERVSRYFRWRTSEVRAVIAGEIDFEDINDVPMMRF